MNGMALAGERMQKGRRRALGISQRRRMEFLIKDKDGGGMPE